MQIPAHQLDKIQRVQELYSRLDEDVVRFKTATSLGCVNGCGRCCENPAVFATILEVLPLAYALWNKGQAEDVLEKIRRDRNAWCNFYQQDPLGGGQGRCSAYAFRPLICRLFGYSTKKDKHGQAALVTCTTMKDHCSAQYAATSARLSEGTLPSPSMQDYAMQVLNIDPSLGQEQFPINEAVAQAIEKIGLLLRDKRDEA